LALIGVSGFCYSFAALKNKPTPVEWRAVLGFPAYLVSESGALRATHRNGHQPRPRMHPKGFLRVVLEDGPVTREVTVHRLVCEAFHGIPLRRRRVVHLDGNQSNNAASNLAWGAPVRAHKRKPFGAPVNSKRAVSN